MQPWSPQSPQATSLDAATPEEEAPVDEDGESTWWVWALLIAAVVAVIAVVAARAGRRRRVATQWRSDARTALDGIDQLTMQLETATPESI
jgi:heme/copper-type cytochrome/quinol oxidase subunit 2